MELNVSIAFKKIARLLANPEAVMKSFLRVVIGLDGSPSGMRSES